MLLLIFQDTLASADAPTHADVAGTVEAWVKSAAIIVAGVWTYLLFVKQRQRFPRATVTQTCMARSLTDGRQLLTVRLCIANIGVRLLEVDYITVLVQQLAPLSQRATDMALAEHDPLNAVGRREILWYRIGHRRTPFKRGTFEVEPGEAETVDFDFVIQPSLAAIRVDSHVENVAKRHRASQWLSEHFPRAHWLHARRSNRCLGWQAVTYHNIPAGRLDLKLLPDASRPEANA